MASHTVPLAEAEKWLDHLGSCSPCYRDFSQFQKAYQLRRKRTLLAIAASIFVAAGIAGWFWQQAPKQTHVAQSALLDLRDRSVARGVAPNAYGHPLEVSRAATRLDIYLPLGSNEGRYDVRILAPSGEPLVATSGIAKVKDHITSVQISVTFASARPGPYILQYRQRGSEWSSYALVVQ